MKYGTLPLLGLLLAAAPISAQDSYESAQDQRLRFGVYVAPNISWMHATAGKSDDGQFAVTSNGSKLGYSWGIAAEYFFAENYGLATGFQLTTTGGQMRTENVDPVLAPRTVRETDFSYTAQYLEIPFGLKLRSDEFGKVRFFGQIGLSLGVNIGKKADYTVVYRDDANVEQTLTGNKEKLVGSLTMAPAMLQMNVGAGVEYSVGGKMALYTGVFFNNGFLPDATRPDKFALGYDGVFTDGNTRLNNVALRIGLFF